MYYNSHHWSFGARMFLCLLKIFTINLFHTHIAYEIFLLHFVRSFIQVFIRWFFYTGKYQLIKYTLFCISFISWFFLKYVSFIGYLLFQHKVVYIILIFSSLWICGDISINPNIRKLFFPSLSVSLSLFLKINLVRDLPICLTIQIINT